jgi:GTPase SAR1 family protein
MANWDYVLKFIICGDAAVGKSSLLVRLTDQRFLANPDPTVSAFTRLLSRSTNSVIDLAIPLENSLVLNLAQS